MKIPITDQFIWDAYCFLEEAGHTISFMVHPNSSLLKVFPQYRNPVIEKYRQKIGNQAFTKLIYTLKRNNLIKVKSLEGQKTVILTKDGISEALKMSFNIEGRKKRKDGKWVMVIFDVPEKNRKRRELLRSILHNLGFKLLQHSVWISPYDIFEKLESLLQMNELDNFVKIFLIEKT